MSKNDLEHLKEVFTGDKKMYEVDFDTTQICNVGKLHQPTFSSSDSTCTSSLGPWPYINKYFSYVTRGEDRDKLLFMCQLCLPEKKILSCSEKSRNGLKSHIQHIHSFCFDEFKRCLSEGSKAARSKKRPFESQEKQIDEQYSQGFIDEEIRDKNFMGKIDESANLENHISFVNVEQIKSEYDDSMEIHHERLDTVIHQPSNHLSPGILENETTHIDKKEHSASSAGYQGPDKKKVKLTSGLRTKELVSAVNRLERVLTTVVGKREEDLFDIFGRNVSDQLRQLPRRQAIMAQSKIQHLLIQEFLDYEDNIKKTSTNQEQPL